MAMRMIQAAFALVLVGVFSVALAAEANWIPLRDGLNARFLTAFEGNDATKPRTLVANFVLSDTSAATDQARAIDVADQLFGRIVLVPADTKGFKRAVVNLLVAETKSSDTTTQTFEDFSYARGSNGVWLREAGEQPWKTAQDPAWERPEAKLVELSGGTVYIDFVGQIFAPPGSTKALGVEMRSNTPVSNIPGKYAEIKELWGRLDQAKLAAEGFDFVHIENYSEPLLGKFHVRQRVFVDIRKSESGEWPALPDTAPLDGAKDPLVAGVGVSLEDEATRYASAAVGSIVPVSNRSEEVEGITKGIAIRSRRMLTAPAAVEYLLPKQ
jgi:hypothetical protein